MRQLSGDVFHHLFTWAVRGAVTMGMSTHRTAALHQGPCVGLDFDPATGTYRIAISQTV